MSLNFQVTVKNTSKGAISVGFVINPKNYVQSGFTIYEDMFPVFWHVAKWNQGENDNIRGGDDISFKYKENIYAYLSEVVLDSKTTIGGYHTDNPVNGDEYQITGEKGNQTITRKGAQPNYTYEVINNSGISANTGLSVLNDNGSYNNFLAVNLNSKDTLVVNQSVEIAFFVSPNVIEDTPLMQAEINHPWFSVNSKFIKDEQLTLVVNSPTDIKSTDCDHVESHPSDEGLFSR